MLAQFLFTMIASEHAMPDKTTQAALITGAGRRIGRAIALALSRAGYAVVLHAHASLREA